MKGEAKEHCARYLLEVFILVFDDNDLLIYFDLASELPKFLSGEVTPALRTRIQCLVRSTYAETRLPPALNDILLAHPIPAVVSRFRLSRCRGIVTPSFKSIISHEEVSF